MCFDLRTQSLVLTVSVQPEREMPYLHFEFYQDDATVFTSVPRKQIRTCNLTTAPARAQLFPLKQTRPRLPWKTRMAYSTTRDSPAVRFSTKKTPCLRRVLAIFTQRDQIGAKDGRHFDGERVCFTGKKVVVFVQRSCQIACADFFRGIEVKTVGIILVEFKMQKKGFSLSGCTDTVNTRLWVRRSKHDRALPMNTRKIGRIFAKILFSSDVHRIPMLVGGSAAKFSQALTPTFYGILTEVIEAIHEHIEDGWDQGYSKCSAGSDLLLFFFFFAQMVTSGSDPSHGRRISCGGGGV